MSTDGGGELTKRRPLPEEAYCIPDGRNRRLAKLERMLDYIERDAKRGSKAGLLRTIGNVAVMKALCNLGVPVP